MQILAVTFVESKYDPQPTWDGKISVPKNHWNPPMVLDGFGSVLRKVLGSPNHRWLEIPWFLGVKRHRAGNQTKKFPDRWKVTWSRIFEFGSRFKSLTHPQKGRRIARNSHPMFSGCKKKVNIDLTAPPSQPFQPFNSFLFWVEVPKQNSFRFKTKELRKNAGKSSQKCG